MSYVMGIDSSTTATKAILVDRSGSVVVVADSDYGYETPKPRWTEQDPHLWWAATCDAVEMVLGRSGIDPGAIDAVGLTGQMHGSVLLDEDGEVLRPALLWNDQRTGDECDEIRDLLGDRLIPITGNDALTGFTAPKLLWVRHNEPDVWERVRHVLLPKDYVRFRLSGDLATDVADGAGTQLFDIADRTWSQVVLEALGIAPGWMPTTHEGPQKTGVVSTEAARATGLAAGTPIVAGGGDQAANAVGVGAIEPGVVALSLGTSGVVFAATDEPVIEPQGRVHSFCHAVPDRWHLMGVMLSAAGSLRWFRDSFAPNVDFDHLAGEASAVEAGAEGLLFLPYLTGERTPHPDPLARGAFVGFTVRHGRGHAVRAVMEGVAFGLADSLAAMTAAGMPAPAQIRASGGGTKSRLWRQILADVLGAEIATVDTAEGAAYGAAILAMVGGGWHDDVGDAVAEHVIVTPVAEPNPDRRATYERLYELYAELYPALRTTFRALGED